ncbi:PadR family transcriptional regulator [Candidatus Omnitrophota bacterium]
MITNELLLLGLLKEGPKHGYKIKSKTREILSLFAGVDLKSIYYPLRVMERKGLVSKRISKKGKRPQRLVYELTSKGQTRFQELLNRSFLDFRRPQFSLDLSLYFLSYAIPRVRRRRLCGRIFILNKLSKEMKKMLSNKKGKGLPAHLLPILQHNIKMLEAESSFLSRLVKTL